MKHLLLILALATSVVAHAQFWVTSVETNPAVATECASFDLRITGNMPASNYHLSTGTATVSGSTINVVLVFSESGFGLPSITPYDELIPVTGATPAGTYSVVVDYTAAGNTELSTWSIDVDSCGTTCGPDPIGLASVNDISGNVILSWNAVTSSVGCKVRGRQIGTGAWHSAPAVLGTEPTTYTVAASALTPGLTYEWEVKCACSITPLSTTGWSAPSTFAVPTLKSIGELDFTLSPNPANNYIDLGGIDAGTSYEIYNSMGLLVTIGNFSGPISVENLVPGMYFIRTQKEVLSFQVAR